MSNLIKILDYICLLYKKKNIKKNKIKFILNNINIFTHKCWIKSLILNDLNFSINILYQLKLKNYNIKIIIKELQYYIIILIKIFINKNNKNLLYKIFKKYYIKYEDSLLLINITNNLNINKLYIIINLLYNIEISYYNNFYYNIWNIIEYISIIILK
ncbi:hypothetical protein [Candidatus Annandia adelgestsuga]|uniref:hypothetical protein n=1 Tax=Candidatus Annandia adelgestsuga TaxID=1302411 RepID=UPI0013006595|nr:hypothetical protein [Candidatus Annandia adelgestsuga]